jgi:chemotaxis signal transduction protein
VSQLAQSLSFLQVSSPLLQLGEAQQQDGQRFLKFPLNAEVNALLPLAELQGVISVSLHDILPVPQVAESLLGIINWQGKATWILDLAHLFGATHWCRQKPVAESGMAMLVQVKSETVGLLVKQVSTIETYDPEQCLPVSETLFSAKARALLGGYFLDSAGKPWMLLDLQAVVKTLFSTID